MDDLLDPNLSPEDRLEIIGSEILKKLDNVEVKVVIPDIEIPPFPTIPAQDNSDVVQAVGEVKEAISAIPTYPSTIKIDKPDWYEPTDNKENTDLIVASLESLEDGLHSYKNPVKVHILNDKGEIINKFGGTAIAGGGVAGGGSPQYVDGATNLTDPYGVPMEWNDAGILRIPSATYPLPVTVSSIDLDYADDTVGIWTNTAKDGSGTNYQPIVNTDGQLIVHIAGSDVSMGADPVGLKNIAAATINPATEDTLATLLKPADTLTKVTTIDTITNPVAVTGTFWQATQPVSGTFWQTTQPISAASLPLPTGAATSANQLPDGHNVTVDNAAGGSAVNIQDGGNSITVDQSTATNLKTQAENYQGGTAVGAANPLQVSLANHAANATAVKVNVASGGIASGAIASGAVASGAFAAGSIATGAIVDALADDAAFTPATSRVFPAGHFADDASPDSVNEGDIGASRMSLDRILYVEPPFGIGSTGTTDCTNASMGYRITSSSTRVHNFRLQAAQTNNNTITWGWSPTFANNKMELRPGAVELLNDIDISLLYFGSTYAGDDINYSYTI